MFRLFLRTDKTKYEFLYVAEIVLRPLFEFHTPLTVFYLWLRLISMDHFQAVTQDLLDRF